MPAVREIDGSFVPTPRADVAQLTIESEMILLRDGEPLGLNPSASLVWQCFDGRGDLAEIVADVVATTRADESVVRDDVLRLTRALARRGLLEGVSSSGTVRQDASKPTALEVGSEIAPFTMRNLQGSDTEWASFRGKEVLLVSWNPGCAFCVAIVGELGRLQPFLEKRWVTLVLVSRGREEANHDLLATQQLDATVLLKRDAPNPFKGFGTPSAYLFDAEGMVAAPLAHGAFEVLELGRRAAGVASTPRASQASPRAEGADGMDDAEPIRYLPAPPAVCADRGSGTGTGTGTGTSGSYTEWVSSRVYRVDRFHVGIRHNGAETADILNRLFAGNEVHDQRVPDNYSVALYPQGGRRNQKLNLLVKGGAVLVRSRSKERVLWALLTHLSADVAPPLDEPQLALRSLAAVKDGRAVLLPTAPMTSDWAHQLQPLLARSGFQLADLPVVVVDSSTAELVVLEPTVAYDPNALDGIDDGISTGSELPPVAPGRYPLRLWIVGARRKREGPTTGADAVLTAAGHLSARQDPVTNRTLEDLARLVERVPPLGVHLKSSRALVSRLVDELWPKTQA